MIRVTHEGSFENLETFLARVSDGQIYESLAKLGQDGVAALAGQTPVDTGRTADLWSYRVIFSSDQVTIQWTNDNINNGFPVAVMLQYGHGTGTGGYVQGRDYINPAIQPVFDRILIEVWRVVVNA